MKFLVITKLDLSLVGDGRGGTRHLDRAARLCVTRHSSISRPVRRKPDSMDVAT